MSHGSGNVATAKTFHRKPLPAPAVAFSSKHGQQLFAEALAEGTMGCFFRLIEQFRTQDEPAFCGLGTLAMVLNALNVDPGRTWKGPWRWFSESMLDCCEPLEAIKTQGITFSKVACLARCNGALVEAHRADEPSGSLDEFRLAVCTSSCEAKGSAEEDGHNPLKALVVSYSRKQFNQTGDGHYSPIGGYHKASDQVLVLDVARFKHPPHWVPLVEMWESMRRVDPATGRCRGFMLVSPKPGLCSSWLTLAWRGSGADDHTAEDSYTLAGLRSAFASALLQQPLPEDGKAAAAEVLRRALDFSQGPSMPLTVLCRSPMRQDVAQDGEHSAASEQSALQQVLAALAKAGADIDGCLGAAQLLREGPSISSSELAGDELKAAKILSLDLSIWQKALSPGSMLRAEPEPSPKAAEDSAASASAAWDSLRPLLELEALPEVLRADIASLRAKWADLLTAREEMPRPASKRKHPDDDNECCKCEGVRPTVPKTRS